MGTSLPPSSFISSPLSISKMGSEHSSEHSSYQSREPFPYKNSDYDWRETLKQVLNEDSIKAYRKAFKKFENSAGIVTFDKMAPLLKHLGYDVSDRELSAMAISWMGITSNTKDFDLLDLMFLMSLHVAIPTPPDQQCVDPEVKKKIEGLTYSGFRGLVRSKINQMKTI